MDQASIKTAEPVVSPDSDDGRRLQRRRAFGYHVAALAAVVLLGAALLDGLGTIDVYGVDTATVGATASDGTELAVEYPTVSRPGLATPFTIVVRGPGGFSDPVDLAIDADYLAAFDENGVYPQPDRATYRPGRLVWSFDPPPGDVLVVSYDARIEPAVQWGRDGFVQLLDPEGRVLAEVEFRTRIRP